MVTLEQVKLLESKVTRTIDYVKKVTEENGKLKEKLDSYQKRIDDLELLIQRFREDQSRIEDGILSALDRLNQFEDALESKLSTETKLSTKSKANDEDKSAENSPKNSTGAIDTPPVSDSFVPEESKPVEEPEAPAQAEAALDEKAGGEAQNPDAGSSGELDIF